MKAILFAVRPEWLVKILNGEKTIEVRKNKALANAIKELIKQYGKALIYMYCSKDIKNGLYWVDKWVCVNQKNCIPSIRNGKVVARFWCDKVEYIEITYDEYRFGEEDYLTDTLTPDQLYNKSLLDFETMNAYLKGENGYAIHISKLEIFDRPRELSDFYTTNLDKEIDKLFDNSIQLKNGTWVKPLTKAPQNYCYVEGEQL